MNEFDITEGGTIEFYYLTRKSDGRRFTCMLYYDPTLDYEGEIIEAHDEKTVTREEKEAVKKAIAEFLGN